MKNKYLAPRGDSFYYIEVYTRELKLSSILNGGRCFNFLSGSQSDPKITDKIYKSLFWKNKDSAEFRIRNAMNSDLHCKNIYVIKQLTREQFIFLIPTIDSKDNFYLKNKNLKQQEVTYKKKIENVWQNRYNRAE